jgi:hypothetical protein
LFLHLLEGEAPAKPPFETELGMEGEAPAEPPFETKLGAAGALPSSRFV